MHDYRLEEREARKRHPATTKRLPTRRPTICHPSPSRGMDTGAFFFTLPRPRQSPSFDLAGVGLSSTPSLWSGVSGIHSSNYETLSTTGKRL